MTKYYEERHSLIIANDDEDKVSLDDYDQLAQKMPRILRALNYLYTESRDTGNDDISEMIGSFFKMADLCHKIVNEKYDLSDIPKRN